jgi:DNA-binding response OmpR family regulator
MKVLVADDEPTIRSYLTEALKDEGFSVFEASNGRDAFALFDAEKPDIVILDIVMPYADGIETLSRIRHQNPAQKIIVISGGGRARNFDALEVAERVGATTTVRKPFRVDDIVRLVKAELAGRER